MNKQRLEAFSDGVLAIIITIMILELKLPEGSSIKCLSPLLPAFLSYILSFVFIGIYWVNHHHLLHTVKKINGAILWANLHLLFWLSLIPFATGCMGANKFDRLSVAVYGALLWICGAAFSILSASIQKTYTRQTPVTEALKKDRPKRMISLLCYTLSIPAALFVSPILAASLFVLVSIMWMVPSRNIEKALIENE
jgi:uncharacterized membrane protein